MLARLSTVALLFVLVGCSDRPTSGQAGRPTVAADTPPPVIDTTQMAYDPDERTLHLYELIADPKTGRKGTWEVWLSDRTVAYPTGPTFRVPPDVYEHGVVIRAADQASRLTAGVRLTDLPRKTPTAR